MIMNFIKQLKQFIFPQYCLCCDEFIRDGYICTNCDIDLPYLDYACRQCAYPLAGDKLVCGECLKRKPAFDRTFALFLYKSPIDSMLRQLKFHGQLHYASFFASCFEKAIPEWYHNTALPEMIIPMPLHPKRLRERGYNQAYEICRALKTTIPKSPKVCARKRYTQPQSELSLIKRRANVSRAFSIIQPIKVRHLAIVDDIVTTANTIEALSQILKQVGVERIDIWSCARAAY